MREIQTFILRLLVDADEQQTLRGVLRAVADGEEYPFADEGALLALLRRMGHPFGASVQEGYEEENSSEVIDTVKKRGAN